MLPEKINHWTRHNKYTGREKMELIEVKAVTSFNAPMIVHCTHKIGSDKFMKKTVSRYNLHVVLRINYELQLFCTHLSI